MQQWTCSACGHTYDRSIPREHYYHGETLMIEGVCPKCATYEPTPEEIRIACLEIQNGWSKTTATTRTPEIYRQKPVELTQAYYSN